MGKQQKREYLAGNVYYRACQLENFTKTKKKSTNFPIELSMPLSSEK